MSRMLEVKKNITKKDNVNITNGGKGEMCSPLNMKAGNFKGIFFNYSFTMMLDYYFPSLRILTQSFCMNTLIIYIQNQCSPKKY